MRSARSLAPEDILFIIRRDPVRISRLREFLSWKDLRKNVKAGEDAGGIVDAVDDELVGFTQLGTTSSKIRRRTTRLSWDVIPGMIHEVYPDVELEEDEEPNEEAFTVSQNRLRLADQMTREMSREEYVEYSECRQASFTYKKAKKFRDWLNTAQYIDFRLSDDVVEILGFLAWDLVRILTETALRVRRNVRRSSENCNIARSSGSPVDEENIICNLFASPSARTAITPENVYAALLYLHHSNMDPAKSLSCSQRPLQLY